MSPDTPGLPEKLVLLSDHLRSAGVPHAFGGAIALAYCVPEPRATFDLDVNLFVPATDVDRVLHALPTKVEVDDAARGDLDRDGQARLWWGHTPVDVFLNTTDFHEDAALRIRRVAFGDASIPVLACRDLAVFKAFFDRAKDWVDLTAMAEGGVLDVPAVVGVLVAHLGPDDHRVGRLLDLA